MKVYLKRSITLILAVIMLIQLVGCGGKETKKVVKDSDQFVYVPEFISIDEKVSIQNFAMIGESIYYIKNPEMQELFDDMETSQMEDYQQTMLCAFNIKDKKTEELPITLKEDGFINKMISGKENTLWILQSAYGMIGGGTVFVEDNNGDEVTDEDSVPENATYLIQINIAGEVLQEINISELLEKEQQSYINHMTMDDEGNIFISNGESIIWVLDSKGTLLTTIPLDTWISEMSVSKEGTVIVSQYGAEGKIWKSIDSAKKEFDKTYPGIPMSNGNDIIVKGNDTSVIFTSNIGVSTYDLKEQKSEELFNWADCNITSNSVRDFVALEDGRIVVATSDYSFESPSNELVILSKVPSSEVEEKIILTFGTFWLDSSIETDIVNFNKSNAKYRIKIKQYMSEDIEYQDAVSQFNADIISGNTPDIINIQGGVRFDSIVEKGVFEDLYPYIERDSEISIDDYFENILKTYDRNGKLYGLMGGFSIQTLLGKTSDIGDRTSWTMEEFIEFANEFPAEVEVFDGGIKASVLNLCISNNINNFVNWNTGECSFNTKEFERVLEFANQYPDDWNYEEDAPSLPVKLQTGKLILSSSYINSLDQMLVNQLMFEADTTYIGYPTATGSGINAMPNLALAMSAKSKNKEGAWEFLKVLISDEAQQKNEGWGFPVQKKAFDAIMQKEMTPNTYIDAEGNEVVSKSSWGFGDWECEVPIPTEKDVAQLKEIISKISTVPSYDEEMLKIITEEAESYFKGAKSAADVAQIIQSRIQIYVSEKK